MARDPDPDRMMASYGALAARHAGGLLRLPLYPSLGREEQDRVVRLCLEALETGCGSPAL